jgi:hypothetical protein
MKMNEGFQAEFQSDFPRKHGCAWFVFGGERVRDPNKAGGWASIGGQEAFQFKTWKDLPDGIVWWTNLSKSETWTLGRWAKFKDSSVFGFDWNGWMSEQVVLTPDDLPHLVAGISETFARTGFAMSQWCQLRGDEASWSWGEGSFADALAERLDWAPRGEPSPQPVLSSAYREEVGQWVPPQELNGKRKLVVTLPRCQHAQTVRYARIPKPGAWRLLEMGAFPGSPDHAARWLADQSAPLLVKIGEPYWRPGEEARGAFWLGNRGRRFSGAEFEPVWLTGEEAMDLGRFAEFQLLSVYASDNGWESEVAQDPFDLRDEQDPLAKHANSWQLRASGAWRALASPTRDPEKRSKAFVSERCLWMRSLDRRLCFESAYSLEREGFKVMGHGDGQAVLILDPAGAPIEWARALKKAGWCLPMGLARILPMDGDEDFEDFLALDHWIKRSGGMVSRWNVDRIVAPWSSASGSVRSVMQKAAQDLLALDTSTVPHWKKPWTEALQTQARRSVNRLKQVKGSG